MLPDLGFSLAQVFLLASLDPMAAAAAGHSERDRAPAMWLLMAQKPLADQGAFGLNLMFEWLPWAVAGGSMLPRTRGRPEQESLLGKRL